MVRSVDALHARLDAARRTWGADCCTFFLRDPWWTTEFRLLAMPGVEIPEPMHGFVFPGTPAIVDGDDCWLVPDAPRCDRLRIRHPAFDVPAPLNRLFGDFIHREGIASCVRLLHRGESTIEAVLFAYFRQPQSEAILQERAAAIQASFQELCADIPTLREELDQAPFPGRKLIHLLRPAGLHPDPREFRGVAEPRRFFMPVLKAVFEAFGFRHGEALGTVHLYHPERDTLVYVDRVGWLADDSVERNRELVVRRGEGVVCWAAALRRAVLLNDVKNSSFAQAFREYRPGIQSELVVPMVVGSDLVGILNFESEQRNAFTPDDARLVAYAANQAAVAYRQYQEILRLANERAGWFGGLLESSRKLIEAPDAPEDGLNALARTAAKAVRATECDFWRFLPAGPRFKPLGASYRLAGVGERTPRPDGWSRRIIQTHRAVWIDGIRGAEQFTAKEWDNVAKAWVPYTVEGARPLQVNAQLTVRGVGSTLGLPVPAALEGGGRVVAWFRYPPGAPEPDRAAMDAAQVYALQISLFLESVSRYRQPSPRVLDAIRRSQIQVGAFENDAVRGYVISRPCEPGVSGDGFRIMHYTGDRHCAGILVDGEGHGIRGALNMLPIVSGFRLLAETFPSPDDVLRRINGAVQGMAVGTALCFTLSSNLDGEVRLSAVAGGHPPLVLVRNTESGFAPPQVFPPPIARAHPLGLLPEWHALTETTLVRPGDWVIGYTDGVTDAGQQGESGEFGQARLLASAAIQPSDTPETVARRIEQHARDHAGGEFEDDFTVLVMQVRD